MKSTLILLNSFSVPCESFSTIYPTCLPFREFFQKSLILLKIVKNNEIEPKKLLSYSSASMFLKIFESIMYH